ncbi:acetyl-CoA carboxylase biotin carboxyl carrier protein [Parafrankia elaeagni]|uniref:acetyl-CoA carboxylase biotin carboxyl carrier protein n=1 Tax=Parafrankia elaeagni TaxID=222534 RepID=UPI000369CBB3|nr:biotin/lipoyl-containing protein [Parafrankia elaeagni]
MTITTANGTSTTPAPTPAAPTTPKPTPAGQNGEHGQSGLGEVLAVLRLAAQEAGAGGARPVSRVRVSAGDLAVEIDWTTPDGSAGPGGSAPAAADRRDVSPHGAARPPAAFPSAPASLPAVPGATGPTTAVAAGSAAHDGSDDALAFVVPAHTVGVFYHAPEPGADPFVRAGDTVVPGQQVGIIEAMKLMIPVEAERGGRVREILVADASPVEYGQPLLTLDVDVPHGDSR